MAPLLSVGLSKISLHLDKSGQADDQAGRIGEALEALGRYIASGEGSLEEVTGLLGQVVSGGTDRS